MQNSHDFLSLSLAGNTSKKRSPPDLPGNTSTKKRKSYPQKTHTPNHVPVTTSWLAPYSPCSADNNKENNGGELHVNAPVTALLLSTNPVLAPYTASNSNNSSSDHYGANPVHESAPAPAPTPAPAPALSRPRRARAVQGTIAPPFPWATNQRARIHSFRYLVQNNITRITGRVQCKKCLNVFEMELDVEKKLDELMRFVNSKEENMNDRAPEDWMDPVLPKCEHCGRENSVAPLFAGTKKKAINWLFLFLSQMLGCCTIKQLKYFCKHTKSHRTAAKNRLVYSTFKGLRHQLLPEIYDP